MSEDLHVVMLESASLPDPLEFEETALGKRALIDLPWGRLAVYPESDRIGTGPLSHPVREAPP